MVIPESAMSDGCCISALAEIARDVPLMPPADKLGDYDLLRELGVDSLSLTPLEVRMAAAKKARESSAWAKGSSATLVADSKVDESSPAGDAGVSDLLKKKLPVKPVYLLQAS
ncbi:hypothetical protein L3X38_026156 [Prunus dulcis]|uniref:Uncharacterized protein n=1 Tax=Prunus dulcis TaxID=3755 RepID=A0AAD4Z735_PRUDU|nr:hypothetical protein L3X38_026156 [Prunus dulcis]